MRISKILFFLIVPICLMSMACVSIPVQNSSVISMEETSIEVPRYINRTLYLYTLKGETMPRKTYNRTEVPWHTALVARPGSPKSQYGSYAAVLYEEMQEQVQDGTQIINGFQVTLNNGHTFFVSNTSQRNFQFKIGSNVDYQVSNSRTTIKTVDGRKVQWFSLY